MTELATRPAAPAWPASEWGDAGTLGRLPAKPQSQGERMREWLHLFKECREAAEILARTSFVPKDMMGKPAEIATAMLKGWELGLDPLDALASIYVVHGRVGFYAEFMRRRMIQAGHVFRVIESTDNRCVVEGTRADNGETHRAAFTAEQAKRAKIDIQAYPAEKLVARATSRLVKQAFPDVLSGSLIVEDLLDGLVAVESERVDAAPAESAPVQRRRQPRAVKSKPAPTASVVDDDLLEDPAPVDEPAPATAETRPEPETPQVDEAQQTDLLDDPPADEGITKPQLQKLSILRQREGYADDDEGRADWFRWVQTNIGRLVGSNKDLTKAEASVLIDVLESAQAQDDQR
ncbi:hypothetical protein [Mycobacterium intracellulare]|uniref:RecT-like ssDNA binding protein n=1 Tax=Mycobacterium intracellulare TaxID=1767 RepID=A0AAE4RHL4_MYCIT|nr:hypothetical protein [Mycobacterium intracellulare]MDV6979618.1 hypothetical protein [Mycobacterium intracellulare]MDV6985121.1 hypothetical protein [Mycobacterium intracellulare]MDV7014259.1 hypothetical protein [Mycobacterium intracellulare]MDV7030112.1 hypothetical protein [Mycobacterium intracellulare]